MKAAAYILAFLLVVGGSVAFRAFAPCGMWSLAPVKEVPARCLMNR